MGMDTQRSLSGKGCVLIRGRRAPILGRVCMDQFMVDVTDIPGAAEGRIGPHWPDGTGTRCCQWKGWLTSAAVSAMRYPVCWENVFPGYI